MIRKVAMLKFKVGRGRLACRRLMQVQTCNALGSGLTGLDASGTRTMTRGEGC